MKYMEYKPKWNYVNAYLGNIVNNAEHAVRLKESFIYPAYDTKISQTINGTRNSVFYGLCLESIYFEYIMTLMRMYDGKEIDTSSFGNIMVLLDNDFIAEYEQRHSRNIRDNVNIAIIKYNGIINSHLYAGIKMLRNKYLAHTAINLSNNRVAKYGYADKILDESICILNLLTEAFRRKRGDYEPIGRVYHRFSMEFWGNFIKNNAG